MWKVGVLSGGEAHSPYVAERHPLQQTKIKTVEESSRCELQGVASG